MSNKYYQKKTKAPKRSTWKISKSFWRIKKELKKARQRCQKCFEEEKEKKRQYHRESNKNPSED